MSRILKRITHRDYNHASISLNEDLKIMYSFGRKNPYNPFFGGFVKESADFGTFKRFSNTRVIVLKVFISNDRFEKMQSLIDYMVCNSKRYGYNYLGLWLAAFNIAFKVQNRYYCSEFVRDMLVKYGVDGADKLSEIVHPMSFMEIPNIQTIFCGKLKDYSSVKKVTA